MSPTAIATLASAMATTITVILACRMILRARRLAAEEATEALEAKRSQTRPDIALDAGGRFGWLTKMMRPSNDAELGSLRNQLAQAGLRQQDAVELYSTVRGIAVLASLLGFFVLLGSGLSPGRLFVSMGVLLAGLWAPKVWLRARITARQDMLSVSLGTTLDLLVTCMEAGLGLEQALARVASEIGFSDPEMADELGVVVAELRAGLSIGESFRKMADRVTVDEVRNLANVIVQSATLGASLGRALREYANSSRRRRMLGLEEAAGKITAGLTLPLSLCLLPATILAVLGPAVVMIYRSMS